MLKKRKAPLLEQLLEIDYRDSVHSRGDWSAVIVTIILVIAIASVALYNWGPSMTGLRE